LGPLIGKLQNKVGRLLFEGVPTGVAVTQAMQHGGPFPAATDSRFSSVGTDAVFRWLRPITYQDCPNTLLPEALQNENPLALTRTVDGQQTQASL
jgi:NADP-dependent aldehyde dehydrogenase